MDDGGGSGVGVRIGDLLDASSAYYGVGVARSDLVAFMDDTQGLFALTNAISSLSSTTLPSDDHSLWAI